MRPEGTWCRPWEVCQVLDELGWDREWATVAAGRAGTPGRVVRADGARALLVTAAGEVRVAGSGLVTGDWTLVEPGPDPAGPGTARRLPRRTELVRGAAGKAAARQVLAANVDLVFVLVSLAAPRASAGSTGCSPSPGTPAPVRSSC
jgi:ribosome biogenesis GTPase / thiamine phosphate phosphatase